MAANAYLSKEILAGFDSYKVFMADQDFKPQSETNRSGIPIELWGKEIVLGVWDRNRITLYMCEWNKGRQNGFTVVYDLDELIVK